MRYNTHLYTLAARNLFYFSRIKYVNKSGSGSGGGGSGGGGGGGGIGGG